ncbi:protein phosphatase 1 regulatory subunit 36 [Clarias gariepinus]|uniref:protein phosphatase 1 regulatory subunit 36 n=1 Tax=Clarias gariepinus TaxID=13013 RepID=UPI00234DC825|nr:protein phosphatase 1 regulatory subunit 36 [Clarias gariepinus]
MSKSRKETDSVPPPGTWTWNDETQSLEFTCFTISDGKKRKKKDSQTSTYQERIREHLLKVSQCMSSAKGGSSGLRKRAGLDELTAYKDATRSSQRDSITLEDVKQVALSAMQEKEALPVPLCFSVVIRSKELDEFLVALLLYLHCYWQKKALEERPRAPMEDQSIREQQIKAEASVKVELAKKHLAFCYSSLVLGQGLSQQHHMACGRSRMSSTNRDMLLYECLYSFLCYVAWVTFGRQNLKDIQTEIGCLMRPDMFNPALRALRNKPEEEEEEHEKTQKKSQSATIPSIRKPRHGPGLVSVLKGCSPVMSSILPSLREKASNVFQSFSLHKQESDVLIDTDVLMEELRQMLESCSFGILGKPLSHLSHTASMPQEAHVNSEELDHEDQVQDDDTNENHLTNNKDRKTTFMHQTSAIMTGEKHSSLSRAHTVTSRATTEAPLSDTE